MISYADHMKMVKKLEVEPGIEIAYEELGSGDKYILCTQMSHSPYEYARKFADHGYHVFLLWNRGSGLSTPATEDFGFHWYDVWADDVVRFADKMGIGKFIYTGASHGAGTGWHLLKRHQDRVLAFVALVAGPHNVEESGSNFREIAAKNPGINFTSDDNDDPAILAQRAETAAYSDEAHKHELSMNYGRPLKELGTEANLAELIKTFKVPTIILGGMKDLISTPDLMLRTAKLLPNCKLIIYSGIGHCAPINEITDEVIFECVHFLNVVEENDGRVYAKVH